MIHCKRHNIKLKGSVDTITAEFTWIAMYLAGEQQLYKKYTILSENDKIHRVAELTIEYLKSLDKIIKE